MANDHEFLRQMDRLFQDGTITGLDEGQLLERFATGRDESALAALVERHGPMVLGVCRRLLANPHDVEDAFQATFLILVRKARALRDHHRLGPWLYGVAHRVAARARADAARRRALEQRGARNEFEATVHAPDRLAAQAELSAVVDEEIARLSAPQRAAVVLCDLEGQTQPEAARVLGWSEGALRGRLARARQKLRDRLLRRGVAPSSLAVGTNWLGDGVFPSVPSLLVETTTRAATATLLAGRVSPSAATAISASVTALVQGVIRAMTVSKMTSLASAVVLAAVGLLMLGGLVHAGLSALADNPPRVESPQAPAAAITEKASARTLDFRAVRHSDKQPISGAAVEFSYYLDQSRHETKHTTDGQGRCTIELPQGGSHFAASCGKDGFVPTRHTWGDQEIRAGSPAIYTQELEPGLPIGGFVRDEEGKPVAGADVTVAISQEKHEEPDVDVPAPGNISHYASYPHLLVKTDTQGRWRCSILPANADQGSRLWFFVEHPDYVGDSGGYSRRLSLKTARAMTGVLVMKAGLNVAGQVHDGKGRFVSGATVILAYSPSGGNYLRTTTDAAGQFRFPHANNNAGLGRWSISVEAAGFAPAWKMVVPAGEIPFLEFSLAPAKPFRGQVVDHKGRPVAGARVEPKWQECYFLDWRATTDADGRFVWLSGPSEGEIEFRVDKDKYLSAFGRRISALAGEVKITINPKIRVRGTATDIVTNQPIPKFRVVEGESTGNAGTFWRTRSGTPANDGHFDVSPFVYDRPGLAFFIRIEADGYRPASSRAIIPGESDVDLEFELKKGTGPSGIVKLPDGSPAVGADVYLTSPKYGLPLVNNQQKFAFFGSNGNWIKTDKQGHFAFQPKDEPFGVLVLHSKGVVQKSAGELAKSSTLTLEPFGRVEGILRVGAVPGAKQPIQVAVNRTAYAKDHQYQYFNYQTETDEQGRFVIENVMPGEAYASRITKLPAFGEFLLKTGPLVDLGPGQTVKVEIGGLGRPVVGKVALPANSARRIDLATASGMLRLKQPEMPLPEGYMNWDQEKRYAYSKQWYLSAEGKAHRRSSRHFSFPLGSDGSFRVDDVLPGQYELNIRVRSTPGFQSQAAGGIQVSGNLKRDVEVSSMPGGRTDEPLDLGTLEMTLDANGVRPIAVGEMAPAFDIKTLDGKPLRLGELKGKFVLLDFWATWCGPCLEQEPHVRAAYDSFGKDDRFVIVSLSLDEQTEAPKNHVTKQGLLWIQGFLGQGSTVPDQYGVTSIPQIMLVGPDGRIVAKDLGGPGIKVAVGQALGLRP